MFRNSCKSCTKKYEEKKAHTQIHKLFFKPKHIWMIMEPCVALKREKKKKKKKETYVFISLFTWTFTVLQTSVKAQPVREVALCVFLKKDAFPQRLLPKHKHSVTVGGTSAYSIKGRSACSLNTPNPTPPLPAGFGVTLRPSPPALWPVVSSNGGGQCVLDVLIKRHC